MWIEKAAVFLKGYVVICAEGHFCERFLNICMRRGIYLSNVRRLGQERITACISIAGFREIREIARKTRTRVSIAERHGLPFLLHRYRKRRAALVGVVLFFGILWYLSSHIVGIDVVGNERIDTKDILLGLKEFGVYHGAVTDEIDDASVRNRMMSKFDEIAWIGISLKGSRVCIEIKERLDTPIRVGTDIPCDIVAERDGVVKSLAVREGKHLVTLNQFVEKGDLLVSGVIDSEAKGMRFVHSFGEIYAETIYKKSGEYTFEYIEKIYTGQEKKRYSLSVMGKEFKFYRGAGSPFEKCDMNEQKNEYKAPLSFLPSVFVTARNYAEYKTEKRTRSPEKTVEIGSEELSAELEKEIPSDARILDKRVNFAESENGVTVTVEYVCREDIGQQRVIDKTELLEYDINEVK